MRFMKNRVRTAAGYASQTKLVEFLVPTLRVGMHTRTFPKLHHIQQIEQPCISPRTEIEPIFRSNHIPSVHRILKDVFRLPPCHHSSMRSHAEHGNESVWRSLTPLNQNLKQSGILENRSNPRNTSLSVLPTFFSFPRSAWECISPPVRSTHRH